MTILASLILYQSVLSNYPVQTGNIEFLRQIAYLVLTFVSFGIIASLAGATRHFMHGPSRNPGGASFRTLVTLSLALNDKRSFRIFVLTALIYGLVFGFFSSFIVYRPAGIQADAYGVSVPSAFSVLCCGPFGQMPQFVIYLTQQFAILIIPSNLILLITASWLVGLNAGIAAFAYKNRPETPAGKWLTGFGAMVGLFTACPSCAGFFMLTMLGLGGAVGLALTLSSLQAAFIAMGFPILVMTPILTSRRIPLNGKCLLKFEPSPSN